MISRPKCGLFLVMVMGMICPATLRADVELPALIGDHMVLQAGIPVRIWGRAKVGEAVTVEFANEIAETTADASGHWELWLKPLRYGEYGKMTVKGINRIEIQDVLVGEVWLASGQSNMERGLQHSNDAERAITEAADPQLRLFHVQHAVAASPAQDLQGKWELASPQTVKDFSALAYFFGLDLQRTRKTPVAIIESSFGGTRIESWMSARSIDNNPSLAFVRKDWLDYLSSYPRRLSQYPAEIAAWKLTASPSDRAKVDAGDYVSGMPNKPYGRGSQREPSSLYNGMIAPITPYTIRGILWCQGEANAENSVDALLYRELFKAMILDWRLAWGEGDLPFLYVQLSRYRGGEALPLVRESQAEALKLPMTGMAVSIDVGLAKDIHYPDKATVADRLFRLAQHRVYGEAIIDSGPVLKETSLDKGMLRLSFDHAEGGLVLWPAPVPMYAPLTPNTQPRDSADGKALIKVTPTDADISHAFQISGADGRFHPAEATISGSSLILRSVAVVHPSQVCYAWQDTALAVILWNGAGLPASPFRSSIYPRQLPHCPGTTAAVGK